jgi:hypothetical protein
MPTTNQIIAVAIIGLVATAVVVGAVVYYSLKIHGSGKILAIGVQVYRDANLTEPVSAIDWGTIPAGGYSQLTLYLPQQLNWTEYMVFDNAGLAAPSRRRLHDPHLGLRWLYGSA